MFISGLPMDKIYECGRKFADLLNCKYHLVVSGNRKIMKLTLDFKETDLRHISGLHYIDDIVIENSPSKLFTAILKKEITDDVLKKSRKYNSKELYEGGSIEERVSEMRFLERYLDENNFIRIYRMQEFGNGHFHNGYYAEANKNMELCLRKIEFDGFRVILMTAHRRENVGKPLENICRAAKRIVDENQDIQIICPVHLNPSVRDTIVSILENQERIHLIEPLDVDDMHNVMARSYLIMTDSGGLQEEGPYFGIPVVVLRTETERLEAIEAGTAKLAGVCEEAVYSMVRQLLNNRKEYRKMAQAVNPYGDGHASKKIVEAIIKWGQVL